MTKLCKREKKNKKEGKNHLAFLEIFSICSSIFLLILLLKNPNLVHKSVKQALNQCANFIIPSLFPLMTLSEIITECGTVEVITRPFKKPLSKVFGVNLNATSPYFLGLIGGYTTSTRSAISLYKDQRITKKDCERIIAFSTFPSLAFVINFVGAGILQNPTIGWFLWALCIVSSIIISSFDVLISAIFKRKSKFSNCITTNFFPSVLNNISTIKKPFSKIIVEAIVHAAQSMLIICASVVFFSTLIELLQDPIASLGISKELQNIMLGSLELINGVNSVLQLSSYKLRVVFCGFFIGWSGLCIHFQILSLCDDINLSFKKYFVFKAIQGSLCSIILLLIL